MAIGVKIDVKLDLNTLVKDIEEGVAKRAATSGSRFARRYARKDTGDLKSSIKVRKLSNGEYTYNSNLPYALAQEYGLASFGKPRYGFTPYMRPSTKRVIEILPKIAKNAGNEAIRKAKV